RVAGRRAHPLQPLSGRLRGRLMENAMSTSQGHGQATASRAGGVRRLIARYPFLPALAIALALLALNGLYQPRSVSLIGLTGLTKTYMALMLLAIAQTYVVY